MKKGLTLLFTLFLAAGCGKETTTEATVEKSFDSFNETMAQFVGSNVEKADQATVEKLLAIDSDKTVNASAYFDKDNNALQMILIEAKDSDTAYEVTDAMNYYLSNLQDNASMYNPEQEALLKDGYVISFGEYCLLAVDEDINAVKKAAAVYFK